MKQIITKVDPDDYIIVRFNTETYDYEKAVNILKDIQSSFPNNSVVGIPDDVSLEFVDKEAMLKFIN